MSWEDAELRHAWQAFPTPDLMKQLRWIDETIALLQQRARLLRQVLAERGVKEEGLKR